MESKHKKFTKNNLDKSNSPYLQQHANNPVWWQEFSEEVLAHAKLLNRPILLSSGYSSCHWCHVMAEDAFSDNETSDFLNENFICIKIDREMNPDIDAWMMSYIQHVSSQGGWPLNVFTNWELKPIYALMYASSKDGAYGRPSFLKVIQKISEVYSTGDLNLKKWEMEKISSDNSYFNDKFAGDEKILKLISNYFDYENAGLSGRQKFPPHTSLNYLLTIDHNNKEIHDFARFTLLKMVMSGLHDHLQGGFFRYCVDQQWNIPHFEKMLYDQAMMLINYSIANFRYKEKKYDKVVESIIKCLDETFEIQGLFASAHDADTDHHEGLTYLWTKEEINSILNSQEQSEFYNTYNLIEFEGKFHLTKNNGEMPAEIELKLLKERKKREQAFRDNKIITSWNALIGIGFVMAGRYVNTNYSERALKIFNNLLDKHHIDGQLFHSSFENSVQKESFLEDYASMLLFATYLFDENKIESEIMDNLFEKLVNFKIENVWYESTNSPFGKIPAAEYDHPIPSAVSMAEAAISRYKTQTNRTVEELQLKNPLTYDFFNLAVKWSNNEFANISSLESLDFSNLPPYIILKKGADLIICQNNSCLQTTKQELYQHFKLRNKI